MPKKSRPAATLSQEARVADRLHSAAIHLLRRLRREDDALGLSAARLSALSVVVFTGPLSVGKLAEAEQVRPPTMTRIVAGLEADGLVERRANPADGRRVTVQATAEGRRILDLGRQRRVASLASQIGSLGDRKLRVLDEASEILRQLLQTKA